MAQIDIRDVRKSYGTTAVLHGVSIDIPDGEFVILVGPSGCGKSTLLRMIAGLETVTDGDIQIGNRVVNHVAPKDRDIAMVFQSYALYPHMTVYDNMAFGMRIAKESKDEIDRRVRSAAETLQLTKYLDRLPRALSGGQRQRVASISVVLRRFFFIALFPPRGRNISYGRAITLASGFILSIRMYSLLLSLSSVTVVGTDKQEFSHGSVFFIHGSLTIVHVDHCCKGAQLLRSLKMVVKEKQWPLEDAATTRSCCCCQYCWLTICSLLAEC